MGLDDLRARLTEHASTDPGWELVAYDDVARIKATTPESYDSPQDAFAASEALCAALLSDDVRLRYQARLAAHSDDSEETTSRWFGVVEIGVTDR